MSLMIKGMEMPQAGDIIICAQIEGKLQCTIVTRGKPTKWCEASELSTPHGRLVDADALQAEADSQPCFWKGVIDELMVREAPTIVEAEVDE